MRRILSAAIAIIMLALTCAALGGCGRLSEAFPPGGSGGRVELLVITHPSLLKPAEELAEFKVRGGLSTAVVTTAAVSSAFPGRDLAEKMRNCVIEYHERKGIGYVLLVGRANLVPTRYVFCPGLDFQGWQDAAELARKQDPRTDRDNYVPTDLYFANLAGDWDQNDNGFYGEVVQLTSLAHDEGGFSCQVSVGRIPAASSKDLEEVVKKIEGYEPGQRPQSLFVNAVKDIEQNFNGDRFTEFVQADLTGGWPVRVLSEGQPGYGTGAVLGALNSGDYGLVVALTHGSPFGLAIESRRVNEFFSSPPECPYLHEKIPYYERMEKCFGYWFKGDPSPPTIEGPKVRDLGNGYPFFFLGFGCLIADLGYRPHYSFVEQLVMQERGAIAGCGLTGGPVMVTPETYKAALEGGGGLQFEIGVDMLENLFNKGETFGDALCNAVSGYGKLYADLMNNVDQRKAAFGMTLIGDPTLKLVQ